MKIDSQTEIKKQSTASNVCDASIKGINQLNVMFTEENCGTGQTNARSKDKSLSFNYSRTTDRKLLVKRMSTQVPNTYSKEQQAILKLKQQNSRANSRINTEIKDEDIGDDEEEGGTEITLDSMTRQIHENTHNLGSNNPFYHEKLVKPGSKAVVLTTTKSGALTQRVQTRGKNSLQMSGQLRSKAETKKNYVVLKNPRQSLVQPQARMTAANMPARAGQRDNRESDGSPLTPARVARVDDPNDI